MKTIYRFLYNLRNDTADPFFQKNMKQAGGYLISPVNDTLSFHKLAARVRSAKQVLLLDNGNFSLISKIKKKYEAQASELILSLRSLEHKLHRSARPKDIPRTLMKKFAELADSSGSTALKMAGSGENLLSTQMTFNPTRLIGVEDIRMAVWMALDVEQAYCGFDDNRYAAINKQVAERAVKRINMLSHSLSKEYYPVASAVSYQSAHDAGSIFARAGLKRAAMGFGAYMADDNYSDYYLLGHKVIPLPRGFANRYIRTVLVAKGFWDGYRAAIGRAPEAFHFLGLGAPIMLPLIALCAWGTRELSFDATSPIKDATEGTFYQWIPFYDKFTARDAAFEYAKDSRKHWNCKCPFCTSFMKKHPMDYSAAWHWYSKKRSVPDALDLRPGGGLFSAFPIFSEPQGGILRKHIDFARMGHNHWVLNQIIQELNKNAKTFKSLTKYVTDIVDAYRINNRDSIYSQAVSHALKITLEINS